MPSCTVFGLKQEEVDVMKKEGLKVRLVCDCHHAVWCMTLSLLQLHCHAFISSISSSRTRTGTLRVSRYTGRLLSR